jgi:hypothetical protein
LGTAYSEVIGTYSIRNLWLFTSYLAKSKFTGSIVVNYTFIIKPGLSTAFKGCTSNNYGFVHFI